MSANPYVDSKQLIDTEKGKVFELINERAFINLSVSTGWKPSDDGLYNYTKDIVLPIKEGDAPITMAYYPFVMIPQNSSPTCRPSNFPYARTVSNNTVRLYAYKIPDPIDMLPVVITMKEANSNEGHTNGTSSGGLDDSGITVRNTIIQVKGTTFLVPIDEDKKTTEQIKVEMTMTAFRGEEKREVSIGNIETLDIMFNMNGSPIPLVDNNITYVINNDAQDKTATIVITIPKDTVLKDKMAYFIVPISSDGLGKFARATLLTTRTDETVSVISRYEIDMPKISRSTSGTFYSDGAAVGESGIEIKVNSYTVNGYKAPASGFLVIRDSDIKEPLGHYKVLLNIPISGAVFVSPDAIFNNVDNIIVEFVDDAGKVGTSLDTGIATSKQDIEITLSQDYIVPKIEGDEYLVSSVKVNFYLRTIKNFIEPFYGTYKITDDEGVVLESTTAAKEVVIPQKRYDSASLPSFYKIELKKPGETTIAATAFVSILRKGEATVPLYLSVTPGAVVIPANQDGIIANPENYVITARVLKGVNDVSNDWTFTAEPATTFIEVEKEGHNKFELVSMTSISGVVTVSATLGSDVLTQQVTFSRIKQNDSSGNFTFIRYGNKIEPDDSSADHYFELTEAEEEGGELGIALGEYYGIATSSVDEAPLDADLYNWFPINGPPSAPGEQGKPGTSFYLSGETLVKIVSSADGSLTMYPSNGTYKLESVSELNYHQVKWQYQSYESGGWLEFSEEENQEDILNINYNTLPFGPNNKISIRAEVQVMDDNEIKIHYSEINIYLIYSNHSNYYGELVKTGNGDKFSHVFPVDRFQRAIDGLKDTKNPIFITPKIYKGLDELEFSFEEVPLSSYQYAIERITGTGASLSYDVIDGIPNIYFDNINNVFGTAIVQIRLFTGEIMHLPFNWSTYQVQNNISSSVEPLIVKDDFIVENATLADIKGWSDLIANRPDLVLSLNENNEPIEVEFQLKNTNIEDIFISKDSGYSYSRINPELQYNNATSKRSPLTIVEHYEEDGILKKYSGSMIPGEYYLIVSKGFTSTPKLELHGSNDLISEVIELPANYNFGSSKAMIIKPVNGVERFVYSDDSPNVPYLFKFTPLESSIDILNDRSKYNESLLLPDELGSTDPKTGSYGDILPTGYVEVPNLPYSFEVSEQGIGYFKVSPLITLSSLYFDNTKANSSTSFKVETTTGEATIFSINRRVFPYKELGELGDEVGQIFKGTYLDLGSVNTLKLMSTRMEEEVAGIHNLINIKEVISTSPARRPGRVPHTILYSPKLKNNIITYEMPTVGEISDDGDVDFRSILGMTLYDKSYYYLSFKVKSGYIDTPGTPPAFNIKFEMRNKMNGETIGETSDISLDGSSTVSYIVPATGIETLPPDIISYLTTGADPLYTSEGQIKTEFTNRKTEVEADAQFAPYYLYLLPSISDPKIIIDTYNFEILELRPEIIQSNNIYSELQNSQLYNNMISSTNSFINQVSTLVSNYEIASAAGLKILTSDYLDVFAQMQNGQKRIEEIITEMSIISRRASSEGIFQSETNSRGHIFGFTDSTDYLSSMSITPSGTLVKGEKHQIIGSTSIGELYGKKLVIGKEITNDDIQFDIEYRKDTNGKEGFIAIWDPNPESPVWSSSINKDGHFFMRYSTDTSQKSLVGYMVMDSNEIAAYQLTNEITTGLSEPSPVNVGAIAQKNSIFSIKANGSVDLNRLVIKDAGSRKAQLDLMDVIRIIRYTSADNRRDGIVFIAI